MKSFLFLKPYYRPSQAAAALQVFLTIFYRPRKTEIWLQTWQWVTHKALQVCPTWTHVLLPLWPHFFPVGLHSLSSTLTFLTGPRHRLFPRPGTLIPQMCNTLLTEAFLTTLLAVAIPYLCIPIPLPCFILVHNTYRHVIHYTFFCNFLYASAH